MQRLASSPDSWLPRVPGADAEVEAVTALASLSVGILAEDRYYQTPNPRPMPSNPLGSSQLEEPRLMELVNAVRVALTQPSGFPTPCPCPTPRPSEQLVEEEEPMNL